MSRTPGWTRQYSKMELPSTPILKLRELNDKCGAESSGNEKDESDAVVLVKSTCRSVSTEEVKGSFEL